MNAKLAKKRILVLGSTGSIGVNVLEVAEHHRDDFEVVGLTANRNIERLREQCERFPGVRFAVGEPQAHDNLLSASPELTGGSAGHGDDALIALIDDAKPDLVVNALVGFAGLRPTLHAIASGIDVALANKEAVVTGGKLLREATRKSGARLVPIDSEHVAISQCLKGSEPEEVEAIIMTASGGALRDWPIERLPEVTPADALAHPTWDMGPKITIDSATLMNKGLEVIEAHWLFDMPYERIKVVIHPQSIVHSIVEFRDNSMLAQLGVPDMRLPILYALGYPARIPTSLAKSRITDFPTLTFTEVDERRYPCFRLAVEAGIRGGTAPTIVNSANEFAVGAFLAGKVPFSRIGDVISAALDEMEWSEVGSFDDVYETDRATRVYLERKFEL